MHIREEPTEVRSVNERTILYWGIGGGLVLLGVLFLFSVATVPLHKIGVPVETLSFADLRPILGAGESIESGFDPMVENPGDPWGRVMNYPRIWLVLPALGLTQNHVQWVGFSFMLLFGLGMLMITDTGMKRGDAWKILLCVFSPALLLAFERGNNDLFIFFCCCFVVFLANRGEKFRILAYLSFFIPFIFKLFSVFGLVFLVRETRRRFFVIGFLFLALAVFYIWLNFEDLQLILSGTPHDSSYSYGVDVFPIWINSRWEGFGFFAQTIAYMLAFGCLVGSVFLAAKSPSITLSDGVCADAFRIGSAIYTGSYMLGSNWDYRLMFLILTVPQLLKWIKSEKHIGFYLSKFTLIGVWVSLWHLALSRIFHDDLAFIIDEVVSWGLLFSFLSLFLLSLPRNFKSVVLRIDNTKLPNSWRLY